MPEANSIFFADSSSFLKRLRTCAKDTLELNCSSMVPQCWFLTLGFRWFQTFVGQRVEEKSNSVGVSRFTG